PGGLLIGDTGLDRITGAYLESDSHGPGVHLIPRVVLRRRTGAVRLDAHLLHAGRAQPVQAHPVRGVRGGGARAVQVRDGERGADVAERGPRPVGRVPGPVQRVDDRL